MSAERNLRVLLAGMDPVLDREEYAFCTLPQGDPGRLEAEPLGWFRESEGVTAIVPFPVAVRHGWSHGGPLRRITLQVYSSLDAVGFLASLLEPLARAGISVNVVSAFQHDHLFVPSARGEEALAILQAIQREAPG